MSFQYMALFTGDYIRDTRHLTPEEHGVYLGLLIYCWDQKGPVPLDERKQCGIVNARSGGEIESLRRVLSEFFVRMEDGYYNARMDREITKCEAISSKRKDAGIKGYQSLAAKRRANAQQVPDTCLASAAIPIPIPIPKEEKRNVRFQRTAIGFDAFWKAWPSSPRKVAKEACRKKWLGMSLDTFSSAICEHVSQMREARQWRDGYEPAPLTYLNQRRWEDEATEGRQPEVWDGAINL